MKCTTAQRAAAFFASAFRPNKSSAHSICRLQFQVITRQKKHKRVAWTLQAKLYSSHLNPQCLEQCSASPVQTYRIKQIVQILNINKFSFRCSHRIYGLNTDKVAYRDMKTIPLAFEVVVDASVIPKILLRRSARLSSENNMHHSTQRKHNIKQSAVHNYHIHIESDPIKQERSKIYSPCRDCPGWSGVQEGFPELALAHERILNQRNTRRNRSSPCQ